SAMVAVDETMITGFAHRRRWRRSLGQPIVALGAELVILATQRCEVAAEFIVDHLVTVISGLGLCRRPQCEVAILDAPVREQGPRPIRFAGIVEPDATEGVIDEPPHVAFSA